MLVYAALEGSELILVMWVQMYKAALQQEEQKTPAFLRMQQEAQAKEAEEEAEKKRRWEEEVASKRFWVRSCSLIVATVAWCCALYNQLICLQKALRPKSAFGAYCSPYAQPFFCGCDTRGRLG